MYVLLYSWNAVTEQQAWKRRGQRWQSRPWRRVLCTIIHKRSCLHTCSVMWAVHVTNKQTLTDRCFFTRYDLLRECALYVRLTVLSYRAGKVKPQMFWTVCALQWPTCDVCVFFSVTVSQSNSSLKKHRNRSIFSPFFCCFRDYNAEPPATNNKTCSLPPPAEENSSPPKVRPHLFL